MFNIKNYNLNIQVHFKQITCCKICIFAIDSPLKITKYLFIICFSIFSFLNRNKRIHQPPAQPPPHHQEVHRGHRRPPTSSLHPRTKSWSVLWPRPLTPSWHAYRVSILWIITFRDAVFPTFVGIPTFSDVPIFFFFFRACTCIVCVTTMRVNWWLSGQFWLRKSSSFKGASPLGPDHTILSYFFNSPSGIPVLWSP